MPNTPTAKIKTQTLIAAALLCLSSQAWSDWSADRDAWLAGWRTGKVIQVVDTSVSGARLTSECQGKTQATTTGAQRTVVLQYTQTRRKHRYEMPVSADTTLQRGDVLRFNVNDCTLSQQS